MLTLEREKGYLLSELVQVKGLMPLLMKRRNRMHWSKRDNVLPGGMAMLPILAWWLDRRRGLRAMST